MTPMITLPQPSSAERVRLMSMELIRRRALDRLYERRDVVEDLIRALEDYQKLRQARMAQCITFPVQTCQSDSAQSQI
jgi:hypothetical protein